MVFFVLILLLIGFSSASLAKPNCFNTDYISKENANAIKGIFVLLVFLSHGKSYITLDGVFDAPYIALQNHLNQVIVVMFFFYSGFGMMEQIRRKRFAYCQSIIRKRFPKLLINFDLAVVLFLLADWLLGKHVPIKQFFLALTAWNSIGNSNWFIFDVLVLYLLTCLAFLPLKRKDTDSMLYVCTLLLSLLSIGFVYVLMKLRLKHWWYDTLVFFSMGFWYSLVRDRIEKVLLRNDLVFMTAAGFVFALYVVFYYRRWNGVEYFSAWTACFVALTVMFSMKVRINSEFFKWFGDHVFSVYILQRLPFMLFHKLAFFGGHKYLFLLASFVATIPLALLFEACTRKLERTIWRG